jgi:hypothetical protein
MFVTHEFPSVRGILMQSRNRRDIRLLCVFDHSHAIRQSDGGDSNSVGIGENLVLVYWDDGRVG